LNVVDPVVICDAQGKSPKDVPAKTKQGSFLRRNFFYILVLNQCFALDFRWRFGYDIPIQYKGLGLP
jgi:hypothetical protein